MISLNRQALLMIPCVIVQVLFIYSMVLINVRFEAETLKDLLYNVLSEA